MAPFDGSAWEEEDDEAPPPPDVPYYNNFPGKQPPPGGLIDMRTRPGATLVRKVHTNATGGWDTHMHMFGQIQPLLLLQIKDDTLVRNLMITQDESELQSSEPEKMKR